MGVGSTKRPKSSRVTRAGACVESPPVSARAGTQRGGVREWSLPDRAKMHTEKKHAVIIASRAPLVADVETLCTFEATSEMMLQAMPLRPFKPSGLLLWDVPGKETVRAFVGTDMQLEATFEPVPARWFAHWRSFSEILRAIAEGLEPPGWGEWNLVYPGVIIRLIFSEPIARDVQAVMWGHTVRL